MAQSSNVDRQVLWYGPRGHAHPGPRNERLWLLWPSLAYMVVAPEPRTRILNALQRAVLGVLTARRLTAVELASRLGIHPELAAFVIMELQQVGRLDESGQPTQRGIEDLEDEREGDAQVVPGWVFQDPWSGSLWPYVAASLQAKETVAGANGGLMLSLGTPGKPWHQATWMQKLPPDKCNPPDAREIARASIRHGRLLKQAGYREVSDVDGFGTVDEGRVDLRKISFIEATPKPVFLATFAYIPRDGDDRDSGWYVCDFFGRGSSPELRNVVNKAASRDRNLANKLAQFLGARTDREPGAILQESEVRRAQAAQVLDTTLTYGIRRFSVADHLQDALEAWLEVRELGPSPAPRKLADVMVNVRKALESLMSDVAERFPVARAANALTKGDSHQSKDANREVIRRAAVDLGFAEIPDSLLKVTWGKVRSVSEYGDSSSLRALVVALLLTASIIEGHPFKKLGSTQGDFLGRLDWIIDTANTAAHSQRPKETDRPASVAPRVVHECIVNTLLISGWLLDLDTEMHGVEELA